MAKVEASVASRARLTMIKHAHRELSGIWAMAAYHRQWGDRDGGWVHREWQLR